MKAKISYATAMEQLPPHLRQIVDQCAQARSQELIRQQYDEMLRRFAYASLLTVVNEYGYGDKRVIRHMEGIRHYLQLYARAAYEDEGKAFEASGKNIYRMADLMEDELNRLGVRVRHENGNIHIGKDGKDGVSYCSSTHKQG